MIDKKYIGNTNTLKKHIGNFSVVTFSWDDYWAEQIAIFKATLTTAGVWNKLDLVNLGFSGDYAYLNLKDDSIVATRKGDSYFEQAVGFFGNKSTGYIEYDFIPSAASKYSLNSAYLGVYQWEAFSEHGIIAGCNDGVNYLSLTVARLTTNQLRYRINTSTEKIITYTGETDGYFSLSKTGNNVTVSRNGGVVDTSVVVTTGMPTTKLYGIANNSNGVLGSLCLNKLGVIIAGEYLSVAEDLILYNAINTLISANRQKPESYKTKYIEYSLVGVDDKNIKGVWGDYIFAVSNGFLWVSDNSGATWTSAVLLNALDVDFVYFWDTGTINFGVAGKIYRSTDLLSSFSEITIKDLAGNNYIPHVPINADYPGSYFNRIDIQPKMYRDGNEILLWGNYCNVRRGAAPVNIYELSNDGANITVIYQFGQNPYYTDDGTSSGGVGGNLLGDAGNATKCRHVHSICWDKESSELYFCTGDHDKADPFFECHWGKLVYNGVTWTPTILVSATENSNYKSVGLNLIDGTIYYGCDVSGSTLRGIWKTTITNIGIVGNHVRLLQTGTEVGTFANSGDNFLCTEYGVNVRIYTSNDLGSTWGLSELDKIPTYPNGGDLWTLGLIDSDNYFWYDHGSYSIENFKVKIKVL